MLFIALILIVSEAGLLLAHLGRFSIINLIFVSLPLWLIVFFIANKKTKLFRIRGLLSAVQRKEWFVISGLLLLAIFLFSQPYQYLDGGWDPGNYINTGVHLAREGTIVYKDEILKGDDYEIKNLTNVFIRRDGLGIKYPGLYIKDADSGIVVPQFFHLYPVWVAIFYKIGGLPFAFYVNSFFALGAVIIIFLLGRYFLGRPYGFLAAFLLIINVIEIWNARFATAEILGQFFLLAGFYFWVRYRETDEGLFAFLSGLALGEFLTTNIISVLIVPLVFVYLLYRLKRKDMFFLIPFCALIIHLVIQLAVFSEVYLLLVMGFFTKKEIVLAIVGLGLVIGAVLLIRKFGGINKLRIPILVVLPLLFIYGYFLRPYFNSSIEARNMIELGNYLSPVGLLLSGCGICLLLYHEDREDLLFFVITGLIFAGFFIYSKRMFSRYPFSLRRYIPVVIPVYTFGLVYLFRFLNQKFRIIGKTITFIAVVFLAVFPFYKCSAMLQVRDYYSVANFWSRISQYKLAADNCSKEIYIASSYKWARPLQDVCGFNTVVAREGQVEKLAWLLLQDGKEVFYVTNQEEPYSLKLDFRSVYQDWVETKYLEHGLTFTNKIKKINLCLTVYEVTDIKDNEKNVKGEYLIDVGGSDIGLLSGWDKVRFFTDKVTKNKLTARWTGPEAKTVIPWCGDKEKQILTLKVKGMPEEAGGTRINLYINKQAVVTDYLIGSKLAEYKIIISPGRVKTRTKQRVVLRIESNTWDPGKYGIRGYPEQSGILVDWIKIEKDV